jgi:hypothetical protein
VELVVHYNTAVTRDLVTTAQLALPDDAVLNASTVFIAVTSLDGSSASQNKSKIPMRAAVRLASQTQQLLLMRRLEQARRQAQRSRHLAQRHHRPQQHQRPGVPPSPC